MYGTLITLHIFSIASFVGPVWPINGRHTESELTFCCRRWCSSIGKSGSWWDYTFLQCVFLYDLLVVSETALVTAKLKETSTDADLLVSRQQEHRKRIGERIQSFIAWTGKTPEVTACNRDGQCLLHVIVRWNLLNLIIVYKWTTAVDVKQVSIRILYSQC